MATRRTRDHVSLRRSTGLVCAALVALLSAPPGVAAQGGAAGRLQGQVLDTTGQALPGAVVEVDAGSGAARSAPRRMPTGATRSTACPRAPTPCASRSRASSRCCAGTSTITAGAATTADATLYVAATASVVVTGSSTFRNLSTVSAQDELVGVADAASTGVITPLELNERARRRPAEALESVPGMVVSQHSGEGKANQYYLRGFNIDHGTDLALSVAGHARQPAHARPRAGLRRHELPDSRARERDSVPQGHLRGRVRRLLGRRGDSRELPQRARRAAGPHRGRHLWLRPRARGRVADGRARATCSWPRRPWATTGPGIART